jgi:hypothetical protein
VLAAELVPEAAIITPTSDNSLVVQLLNRAQFPNGGMSNIWDTDIRTHSPDAIVVHNNYIVGTRAKVQRQIKQRLWFYDRDELLCLYEDAPDVSLAFADHAIYNAAPDE